MAHNVAAKARYAVASTEAMAQKVDGICENVATKTESYLLTTTFELSISYGRAGIPLAIESLPKICAQISVTKLHFLEFHAMR